MQYWCMQSLCCVDSLEVTHEVISVHTRALTQPIHRKLLKDESKFIKSGKQKHLTHTTLPPPGFHLSLFLNHINEL